MGNLKYILFIYFTALLSCTKNNSSTKSYFTETTILPAGNVNMYNDTAFIIYMNELEVMKYEVSNKNFQEFVTATNYVTLAEKTKSGMVFEKTKGEWIFQMGADWKHPQGPESTIQNKMDHPVVQVSYVDACAYCEWIGMRLPYESEWEYIFQLDKEKQPQQKNSWDGIFPIEDKGTDGYKGTSPVGSYASGASGCYDLQGNVWEWCLDYYHENWPELGKDFIDTIAYKGPQKSYSQTSVFDTIRVIKGGSFLCADNYCKGYTNQIRMHANPQLGYEHIGFRCVKIKK